MLYNSLLQDKSINLTPFQPSHNTFSNHLGELSYAKLQTDTPLFRRHNISLLTTPDTVGLSNVENSLSKISGQMEQNSAVLEQILTRIGQLERTLTQLQSGKTKCEMSNIIQDMNTAVQNITTTLDHLPQQILRPNLV